jgi:transcriptional regulator with XRE-family HTH domain
VGSENQIGDYLRARRELVRPEDVGLPDVGRRRVPGLRRAEVAMLAGISPDYYMRLEQGRDKRPSGQVIEALSLALRLGEDGAAHLRKLASVPETEDASRRRVEQVPSRTAQLLDSLTRTPALVFGRHLDVLAANSLAEACAPFYRQGTNLVRAAFFDPHIADTYDERRRVMQSTVATLRGRSARDPNDPRLRELIGEMSVRSEEFRELWARHDVKPAETSRWRFDHPEVGYIDLKYEWLLVDTADRMTMLLFHADPGSDSERALFRLAAAHGRGRSSVSTDSPSIKPEVESECRVHIARSI